MADSNITLAFHLVNGSSLPRFLAATNVDTVALEGGNGLGRTLSVYSNSKIHRRPNSFESLNSSSSEYEYDWSNMEQLLQEQAKENTDKGEFFFDGFLASGLTDMKNGFLCLE